MKTDLRVRDQETGETKSLSLFPPVVSSEDFEEKSLEDPEGSYVS